MFGGDELTSTHAPCGEEQRKVGDPPGRRPERGTAVGERGDILARSAPSAILAAARGRSYFLACKIDHGI